jgi:hypothetical protein
MFDAIIVSLHRYQEKYASFPGYNSDLAAEVQERLKQLQYILARVRELERIDEDVDRALIAAASNNPRPPGIAVVTFQNIPPEIAAAMNAANKRHLDVLLEIRLLTEAFYYFAARVEAITRKKGLPAITFKCPGVRRVRDKLIEHPEGSDSRVFYQSFSFGDPHGPRLKAGGPVTEPRVFQDNGLYPNAEEFAQNLLAAFARAMASKA